MITLMMKMQANYATQKKATYIIFVAMLLRKNNDRSRPTGLQKGQTIFRICKYIIERKASISTIRAFRSKLRLINVVAIVCWLPYIYESCHLEDESEKRILRRCFSKAFSYKMSDGIRAANRNPIKGKRLNYE